MKLASRRACGWADALPAVGLTAGEQVTEKQMRNLLGDGIHPAAEAIVTDRLAAGDIRPWRNGRSAAAPDRRRLTGGERSCG